MVATSYQEWPEPLHYVMTDPIRLGLSEVEQHNYREDDIGT